MVCVRAVEVLAYPYTAPIGCYSQGISAEDGAVDVLRDSCQKECQDSHNGGTKGRFSLKDILPRAVLVVRYALTLFRVQLVDRSAANVKKAALGSGPCDLASLRRARGTPEPAASPSPSYIESGEREPLGDPNQEG